jgi:hypothetical protein
MSGSVGLGIGMFGGGSVSAALNDGAIVGALSDAASDDGMAGSPATIGPVGAELGGPTPFGTGEGGIVGGSNACALRGAIPDVPRVAFGICGASGATGDDGVGGRSGIFGFAITIVQSCQNVRRRTCPHDRWPIFGMTHCEQRKGDADRPLP